MVIEWPVNKGPEEPYGKRVKEGILYEGEGSLSRFYGGVLWKGLRRRYRREEEDDTGTTLVTREDPRECRELLVDWYDIT